MGPLHVHGYCAGANTERFGSDNMTNVLLGARIFPENATRSQPRSSPIEISAPEEEDCANREHDPGPSWIPRGKGSSDEQEECCGEENRESGNDSTHVPGDCVAGPNILGRCPAKGILVHVWVLVVVAV